MHFTAVLKSLSSGTSLHHSLARCPVPDECGYLSRPEREKLERATLNPALVRIRTGVRAGPEGPGRAEAKVRL